MSILGLSEIKQPDNKGSKNVGLGISHTDDGVERKKAHHWNFFDIILHSWLQAKFIPQLLCIQSKESTRHSEWEIHMEPTKVLLFFFITTQAKGTNLNPHPKEWINTSQDGQTPSF